MSYSTVFIIETVVRTVLIPFHLHPGKLILIKVDIAEVAQHDSQLAISHTSKEYLYTDKDQYQTAEDRSSP